MCCYRHCAICALLFLLVIVVLGACRAPQNVPSIPPSATLAVGITSKPTGTAVQPPGATNTAPPTPAITAKGTHTPVPSLAAAPTLPPALTRRPAVHSESSTPTAVSPTATPTATGTPTALPTLAAPTEAPTVVPVTATATATAALATAPAPSSSPTSMTPSPSPAAYRFLPMGPARPDPSHPCPGCPRAPAYIVGRVVDAAGNPLAGVRLVCYNEWHRYPVVASKPGGDYDFAIIQAETTWYVVVLDQADQPVSPEVSVHFKLQEACRYLLDWQRVH